MHAIYVLLGLLAVNCATAEVESPEDLGRGFGVSYNWITTLSDGLEKSRQLGQPIMLLIHKSWCSACKRLKPIFAESKGIQKLSEHFVFVNLQDDEEPSDPQYSPDGGYIPRILFIDPLGAVHLEIYNQSGNPKYKFYYSDDTAIISSMKKALSALGSSRSGAKYTDEF